MSGMLAGVSSRETPYRKPAPAPIGTTRGRAVATRPESPEERDRREAQELAEARKKAFRAQSAVALEELERARLAFAIGMRLTGAALLALAFFTIGSHAHAIAGGATSIWVGRMGPWGLFVGPFLIVTGGGGAASKDSLPMWWRVGVVATAIVGAWAGSSFEIDLAIWVADHLM